MSSKRVWQGRSNGREGTIRNDSISGRAYLRTFDGDAGGVLFQCYDIHQRTPFGN